MTKMTRPTSESEIKYKVPVWVVWSSIVLILALSYALIYNQNYFQELQQENTQLKEQVNDCNLYGSVRERVLAFNCNQPYDYEDNTPSYCYKCGNYTIEVLK